MPNSNNATDDTQRRLAQLEDRTDKQQERQQEHDRTLTELTTIRRTLGALSIAVLLSLGGGIVTAVQALARLDALERQVRDHETLPSHRGTVETIATLRGDIREVAAEVRALTNTTATVREEMRSLASRMDAATPCR